MVIRVEIDEAQECLEELVEAAISGDEVIILVGGVPQFSLEPIAQTGSPNK
jgi:antitoxin (DNA-binding transcriptional repressor) of toxin-antitoxin stability system